MKVYMLKEPSYQLPVGIFSSYDRAVDLAQSMFRLCSVTEAGCIEEFQLDPLQDKTDEGIYPWAVKIDVVTKETEIETLRELFYKERVNYLQHRSARAFVFAPNEEEAENRALELWEDYQKESRRPIKAVSIFTVDLDEDGEVENLRRFTAYTQEENLVNTIKGHAKKVEARVIADSADEAIIVAREMYDQWIDEQLGLMDEN